MVHVGTIFYHFFKVFIKFTQDQRFHLRYWHSLLGAWRVFRVCLGSDPLSTVMYCKWLPPVRFIESPRWKWDRGGFETTDPKWGPGILVGTRLVDGRIFLSTSGWCVLFFTAFSLFLAVPIARFSPSLSSLFAQGCTSFRMCWISMVGWGWGGNNM